MTAVTCRFSFPLVLLNNSNRNIEMSTISEQNFRFSVQHLPILAPQWGLTLGLMLARQVGALPLSHATNLFVVVVLAQSWEQTQGLKTKCARQALRYIPRPEQYFLILVGEDSSNCSWGVGYHNPKAWKMLCSFPNSHYVLYEVDQQMLRSLITKCKKRKHGNTNYSFSIQGKSMKTPVFLLPKCSLSITSYYFFEVNYINAFTQFFFFFSSSSGD